MLDVNRENPRSRVARIDPKSGSVRVGLADRSYQFEEFSVMNKTLTVAIACGDLYGLSLRVLMFMISHAKRSNRYEGTQAAIAAELGVYASNVSKAFKDLASRGYIVRVSEPRGARFWYVDARQSFRGAAERHPASLARQAAQREADRKSNVRSLVSREA